MAQNLTITSVKTGGDAPLDIRFNQKVGDDMRKALKAAIRSLQIRHQAWPRGYAVELAFEDKYISKDGPSAAVACALLIEALVRDAEIDPAFAVTGDMNSDASVQPIGGVSAKLEGAIARKCKVMAIPLENRGDAEDLMVLEGLSKLAALQLFTIKDFAQAEALALQPRPEAVQASIDQFAKLRDDSSTDFRSEETQSILREILERTPNHLSAELLLMASLGRSPEKLSLKGSFSAIDRVTAPFMDAILEKKPKRIAQSDFGDAMIKLQQITRKLDERTVPLHNATVDLFVTIRRYVGREFGNRTQYKEAVRELDGKIARYKKENDALASNKEITEELLR